MIKPANRFLDIAPIDVSEADDNAREAVGLLQSVKEIKIINNEQYAHAGETLKGIKAFAKKVEEARKKITKPLDAAKNSVMDLFRGPADALAEAENIIKRSMLTYAQEQERIRQEQERKVQEAARAEEERKRKALEARAEKAEEKGNEEKAEALRQQAQEVFVPRPIVVSSMEKVAGIATKKVWKFRVVDKTKIPIEYMIPNEVVIGATVRATKGTLAIPGIEIFFEETLAASV